MPVCQKLKYAAREIETRNAFAMKKRLAKSAIQDKKRAETGAEKK